jgi:mRNA interferase RelE/StbE
MSVYNLSFKSSVEKDLKKLPRSIHQLVFKKIEQLQNNPLPPQSVKLSGTDNFYRIRVGDYRVVYSADHSTKQIIIYYVRHRREVYRSL